MDWMVRGSNTGGGGGEIFLHPSIPAVGLTQLLLGLFPRGEVAGA